MDTKKNEITDRFIIYYCTIVLVFLFLTLGLSAWIYFQQNEKIENQQLVIEDRNKEREILKDDYNQLAIDYALLNQRLEQQQSQLEKAEGKLEEQERGALGERQKSAVRTW